MPRSSDSLMSRLRELVAARSSMAGGRHEGAPTDHFDGEVFRNQNPQSSAGRSFSDFRRWRRTSTPAAWPRWVEHGVVPVLPTSLRASECAVTFVNHITFLLQFRGLNVLTDPVYSERVSPVQFAGPRRVHAPGVPFAMLPHIDAVLVSHDHYDHLDLDTLRRLEHRDHPLFLTGLGNAAFLRTHGLRGVEELDWWQVREQDRLRCTYVPSQHWSGRSLRRRNRTLWGGFVLDVDGCRVYFAGDTGYWEHFTSIRERCGVPDIALLPIGAYEPRWFMADQHMNPAEAVQAHLDLQARQSVATHFGCFQLTDEAIDAPLIAMHEALATRGVESPSFRALRPGETWRIAARPPLAAIASA